MLKRLILIAAIAPLIGCSSVNTAIVGTATEPPPENYRTIVVEAVKTTFFDPYSIKDAQIAAPQWLGSGNLGEGNAWAVCVRANAKNRMGAYIGMQDTAFFIRGGKLLSTFTNLGTDSYYCRDAVFSPFPEITS